MFLSSAIRWFPTHLDAFNTFYVIGGAIGIASWWILAMCTPGLFPSPSDVKFSPW